MDPQKHRFDNTVAAHNAYQQAISQDQNGDVKMTRLSPHPALVPPMLGKVGPPNIFHPRGPINQSQTSSVAATNTASIHPGRYGYQGQPIYDYTLSNAQKASQLSHGYSSSRYNPAYGIHNHPHSRPAIDPIKRVATDQRGKYCPYSYPFIPASLLLDVLVSVVSTPMLQGRQPWSFSAGCSPSSLRSTPKQQVPAQGSDSCTTRYTTDLEILPKWGDPTFNYRGWRTQNPIASYQIDIVESLHFMSDPDRQVLLHNLERVGWPLRLRTVEKLEGRFAGEDTGSQWSQEDNRALILLRQHCLLSWTVLANKFFLGRFSEECERQFNLLKSNNEPLQRLEIVFEPDLLVEQADCLENLTSALFFETIRMTPFTGPEVKALADAHWLENYKITIIDSPNSKYAPLDLDQKLAIRDALQATGWPTNLRSFQKYKESTSDHRSPWNEDDKKALLCLVELLPKRPEMISAFFPGYTTPEIMDKWAECMGTLRGHTSAEPEPGHTPKPKVSLLQTTLLKATPTGISGSTSKSRKAAKPVTSKGGRRVNLKGVRSTAPTPILKAVKSQTAWSDVEEKKLFALRTQGKPWAEIAQNMGRSEMALKSKMDRLKDPAAAKRKEQKAIARQRIARKNRKSAEAEDRIDIQTESESENEAEPEIDAIATLRDVYMNGTKTYLDYTPEDLLMVETPTYSDVASGDTYMDGTDGEGGQEISWTDDEIQLLHQGKAHKKGWTRIQSAYLPHRTVESMMQKWKELMGRPNRKKMLAGKVNAAHA